MKKEYKLGKRKLEIENKEVFKKYKDKLTKLNT